MELHRLDGLDATGIDSLDLMGLDSQAGPVGTIDSPEIAYEILDENGDVVMYADMEENIYVIDGLGGFFKKIGRGIKKFGKKVIRPVVKTFNRFLNPATILLRNGFLLAMKINFMKVAQRLRFGYLSDSEARKRGANMARMARLKHTIKKAEKIYELAGGKAKNLKKAILKGKGNRDRKVPLNGFGLGDPFDNDEPAHYSDPFEKFVLESDPETVEAFVNNQISVEGLGAVATGTAIAAASGAVASVAKMLDKIGNVFDGGKAVKDKADSIFGKRRSPSSSTAKASLIQRNHFQPLPRPSATPSRRLTRSFGSRYRRPQPAGPSSSPAVPFAPPPVRVNANAGPVKEKSFLEKNKTALVVGGGILVAGTAVAIALRSNSKKSAKAVSGLPTPLKKAAKKPRRRKIPKSSLRGRDALGRFTGSPVRRKPSKRVRRTKTPKRLVPKALL